MNDLLTTKTLMNASAIQRTLDRMASEIVERQGGAEQLALVGIHTAGVPLARRLQKRIASQHKVDVDVGMIDITLYRDDAFIGLPHPIVGRTELPFEVTGQRIIVVDDVLYTGRTIRAALDALMDFGRPQCIQLAVLVDRGHRELPIQADITGYQVQTDANQSVQVQLIEEGADEDAVILREKRNS